jgi:hypothetical protein
MSYLPASNLVSAGLGIDNLIDTVNIQSGHYGMHRQDGTAVDMYRQDANARVFEAFLATLPRPQRDSVIRNARRSDSVSPAGGVNGGMFLARQLDQIIARVLEQPLPPLTGLEAFTVSNEVQPGASTYTVRRTFERGSASIFRGGQRPTPRINITQREEQFPVRRLVDAFQWSIFEQNSAEFAGFSLLDRGVRAANRAIAELQNSLIWNGSSADGLYGVLNYPWLDKKVVATQFSPTADPLDMMAEIFALIEYPMNNSNMAFMPTDVRMSVKLFTFLNRTPVDTANASNYTLLKYIAENNAAGIPLSKFRPAPELNDAGPGGTQAIFVYKKDEDGVRVNIAQSTTPLPLQMIGFNNTQYLYASYGGVVMADVGNNILGYIDLQE